jgi:Uma2 family endonuclease
MDIEIHDEQSVTLRRGRVRFPVELHAPPGFRPDSPETWPRVEGRLEYVGGRLLYMPPCGDIQQDVTVDTVYVLRAWAEEHPDFVVGTNEAGMKLGEDVRGADAAVWRRGDLGGHTGGYRRIPPVLAVEVAGLDEGEHELRAKAAWYLAHGVAAVWLVFPEAHEVLALTASGETRHGRGAVLAVVPALPDLSVNVDRLFAQIEARR